MGILGAVTDVVCNVLDALIDDQQANLRRVLNKRGLDIRGVWDTKEIFLFGEPLSLDVLDKNNIVYENNGLYWGDDSDKSDTTALAILLWFLDKNEAIRTKDQFLKDFVMKFPQEDFETKFDYEIWRNRRFKVGWHRKGSSGDEPPSMDDD